MTNPELPREIPREPAPNGTGAGFRRCLVRGGGVLLGTTVLFCLAWWFGGRILAPDHRLEIRISSDETTLVGPFPTSDPVDADSGRGVVPPGPTSPPTPSDSVGGTVRILTWNIAHGRGDVRQGWRNNWKGGSQEDRVTRLLAMARVIRSADADLVILNEVDFSSHWSGGLNQAEILSRATGYRNRVEQRNFEIHLPGLSFVFGNVLLSRYPVISAQWVKLPLYSTLESLLIGAKAAAVVKVETPRGPLGVVPVHLEFREGDTRMRAAGVLQRLRQSGSAPMVLAGDFNTAPSGWPGERGRTLLDSLLALGWTSPRAEGGPDPREFTFPTKDLRDARDWVLAEPALRVRDVRVLHQAGPLSDHAPVLSVVVLPEKANQKETGESRS